jgi:hypothetical protein
MIVVVQPNAGPFDVKNLGGRFGDFPQAGPKIA